MDLRKSVLKKQKNVLGDSFVNISNLSVYESAAEDVDSTLYFSFSNDTEKSMGQELIQDESTDSEKENTMILATSYPGEAESNKIVSPAVTTEPIEIPTETGIQTLVETITTSAEKPEKVQERALSPQLSTLSEAKEDTSTEEKLPVPVVSETKAVPEKKVIPEAFIKLPTYSPIDRPDEDSPNIHIEIVVEDPNKNIINPFILPSTVSDMDDLMKTLSKEEVPAVCRKVPRRTISKSSQIPFYSPVLRKSLDRKAKVTAKPSTTRKILLDPSTSVAVSSKPVAKPVTQEPTVIPKLTAKPAVSVKPKSYKCSVLACNQEFSTFRAYQDHQKTHKPTTSSQSVICKWCDKKFQLEAALTDHQTEKCPKIPFNEKRKVLAQRDNKEKDRRRTTVFSMPVPKKKSPLRKKPTPAKTPDSKNKSGIKITPKRSLKCHVCQMIIPDAISFANHILSHKFQRENPNA